MCVYQCVSLRSSTYDAEKKEMGEEREQIFLLKKESKKEREWMVLGVLFWRRGFHGFYKNALKQVVCVCVASSKCQMHTHARDTLSYTHAFCNISSF